ncbi:succinyl-diaminopimelate desuccinylase [Thermogladius calderae 1633]|uniref:Succinyl-diaminopimelate desuccinylase n=2 Tax=Thermogladius calderae TaxID=1200300 RepID=I3TEX5_THEC1|nr:succinyl-diaminopimelate desuccinylase [Thermogladius calderae 1633]
MVDYYREVLSSHGVHVTVHRVDDDYVRKHLPREYNPDKPRYILLARVGSGERVLQFNGHYDVVAAGEGWETPPFQPVVKDGLVYGRGATDMKGGIASVVGALAYVASGKEPEIVVEAALVPDEEIGGLTGTGYLVNVLGSRPDWVVIAEPSGIDNIYIGHRGGVWAMVKVYGVQAHGSTPWLGDNAFEKMVYLAKLFIEEYKPSLAQRRSRFEYEMPEASNPTLTLGGKLVAPGSINIVPGIVGFSVDRRLIVEERADEVVEELRRFLENASARLGVRAELEVMEKSDPALTDPGSHLVRVLEDSITGTLNLKPRKTICVGGLDLRYYAAKNIQAVAYGPGEVGMAHKVNEYVKLADIVKVAETYVDLVYRLSPGTSR